MSIASLRGIRHVRPFTLFPVAFSGDAYIFNLKTTCLTSGTYALTFTATGDPNPHQVQFQIRQGLIE
jgi:hypothetical protein